MKDLNCRLVKQVLLSVTPVRGMPNWVNRVLSCWIVLSQVALNMGNTSIHLVWVWTTARSMWLSRGPAKSEWALDHCCLAQLPICKGACGGEAQYFYNSWQLCTVVTISCSIPGHHICIHSKPFILAIPGWSSCNSVSIFFCPSGGIMTQDRHKIQPSSTESSTQCDQ